MVSTSLAIVAAAVVVFTLVSKRIGPTPLSAPMIFAALGLITGPELVDAVDLGLELESIDIIGEATLGVLLFADASRIDTRRLRHEYMLPARLLGIGLPLTVAATTGVLVLLVGDVSVWTAALIAAILSPTDAALGQEVVSDQAVPVRIRQGLTVESGLNDGLIVPAVALFLALAVDEEETGSASFWLRFAGEQIGIGLAVGVVVGVAGAAAISRAHRAGWVDGVWAQLGTFALALLALTSAIALGGNGFIATFVAGLLFGTFADDAEHLGEFTEDAAQLAAAVSFFLFGNILLSQALGDVSVAVVICALAALTVGRMVPVAIAMVGTRAAMPTVGFLGWFGPRGLASILFGLLLLEEELEASTELFAVVAWTVALSILLHGATAAIGARRYGEWWSSMADEHDDMPEGLDVAEQRVRRL